MKKSKTNIVAKLAPLPRAAVSTLILLTALIASASAGAAPAEGTVSRFGIDATTWQEPLRLQSLSGNVDQSVANYRGLLVSYQRQWREKGLLLASGGYGMEIFGGMGQATGGGTSPSFDYKQGATPWTMMGLQPSLIWIFTEQIDFGAGLGVTYRNVSFGDSVTTAVTPSRPLNLELVLDLSFSMSPHFGMKQSLGISSIDVGPFFRWGLSYDL